MTNYSVDIFKIISRARNDFNLKTLEENLHRKPKMRYVKTNKICLFDHIVYFVELKILNVIIWYLESKF